MKKIVCMVLALVMMCSCALAEEINVISREDGSGTRGAFIELFGIEQKNDEGEKIDYTTDECDITNSTSVMMTSVAGNENAIGYISLGSLNDSVKALMIDGAEASMENIKAGAYNVARPFNIATLAETSETAQDFIAFIMSAEGQTVIEAAGYISVTDAAEPFAGGKVSGKLVIAGSSSVTPVMEKLKEAYEVLNPNVEIELQQSDSSSGMTSTLDGVCDIGMASRALKDSEVEAGLNSLTIAVDGIAVIVSNDNPVEGMTTELFHQTHAMMNKACKCEITDMTGVPRCRHLMLMTGTREAIQGLRMPKETHYLDFQTTCRSVSPENIHFIDAKSAASVLVQTILQQHKKHPSFCGKIHIGKGDNRYDRCVTKSGFPMVGRPTGSHKSSGFQRKSSSATVLFRIMPARRST